MNELLKESLIFSALITLGICSYAVMKTMLSSKKNKNRDMIALVLSIFVFIFCILYSLFRFFHLLYQWTTDIQ